MKSLTIENFNTVRSVESLKNYLSVLGWNVIDKSGRKLTCDELNYLLNICNSITEQRCTVDIDVTDL